ncbi:DNA helicase [Actinomycetota bacterium]|nr:DNA helicase [Actinomycetota bacterium]
MVDKAEDIISGLDDEQRKAATTILGPVVIVAGAGTGKTRTITHRIAYACRTGEWISSQVMAVTFTAKAAKEMRERLEQLGIKNATVQTFHAAALGQLRHYWPKVVGTELPKLETNKIPHIMDAAKYHSLELTKAEAQAIGDEIGWCKVSLIGPDEYEGQVAINSRTIAAPVNARLFAKLFSQYDNYKSERGLIDFEDVLLLMVHIISNYKEIREEIQNTYKHYIVDEYQDVSPLQQRLLESWLGYSRELCVVGDPSQTIYSFTGATPHYLLSFQERFKPKFDTQKPAQRINLINDYRSSPQIVKLANKVLSFHGKEGFEPLHLKSKAANLKHEVQWKVYQDDTQEAKSVAKQIQQMLDSKTYRPQDVAVLARTNLQLGSFNDELKSLGVDCYIKQDTGKLREDEQVNVPKTAGGVALVSLHSSKGLEWECVFLVGLSDGQIPISRAKDDYSIEEERRLLYVGITRAKQELYMSFARGKYQDGANKRARSRFLDRIWPA